MMRLVFRRHANNTKITANPTRWSTTTQEWFASNSRRLFSSNKPKKLNKSTSPQTHFIFGANTDVGKTVLSAGLVRASSAATTTAKTTAHYIKPLQCGGSDQRFVQKHAPNVASTTTLFEWETPTSPHAASRIENKPVSDQQVCQALFDCLNDIASSSSVGNDTSSSSSTTCWIETAGGVLSPSSASPDNTLHVHASSSNANNNSNDTWGWVTQGDLYQPFIPVGSAILIGDGRLGGISATLSSLESLIIRGYDVVGIILLETGYANQRAIREYATRNVKLRSGYGSPLFTDPETSIISLPQLPPEPEPLYEWYESQQVTDSLNAFVHDHLPKTWENHLATQCNESTTAPKAGESSMALVTAAAFGRYGKCGTSSPTKRLSNKLVQDNTDWAAKQVLFCNDLQSARQLGVKLGVETFCKDQPAGVDIESSSVVVCTQESSNQNNSSCCLDFTTVQFKAPKLTFDSHQKIWSLSDSDERFATIEEAFDMESRMAGKSFLQYKVTLSREWDELEKICQIASIMVSPLSGTNGFVDPVWHRALWDIAQTKQVPFILDDEETIGWQHIIDCKPDLVVAEVGGSGPLGAVLASEGVAINDDNAALSITPSAVESISALHALESRKTTHSESGDKYSILRKLMESLDLE